MLRAVAAAIVVLAVFVGVMYVRFSSDSAPASNANPTSSSTVCTPITLGLVKVPTELRSEEYAITSGVDVASKWNSCNRPESSTATASRTTWEGARESVRVRGGFVPYRQPVDHDDVWLIQVRGKFVQPTEGGPAIAPSPNMAANGTWFTLIDSLGGQFAVAMVADDSWTPYGTPLEAPLP